MQVVGSEAGKRGRVASEREEVVGSGGRKTDFGVREVGKFSGESACLYLSYSSEEAERMSGRGLRQGDGNSAGGDFEAAPSQRSTSGLTLASLFLRSVRDSHCLSKASFSLPLL